MNLTPVNPHQIKSLWPELEPILQRPYQREGVLNDTSLEDVYDHLMTFEWQLWVLWTDKQGIRGGVLTRLFQSLEGHRVVCFCGAALLEGESPDWNAVTDQVALWAKETENCQEMWVTGRIGWTKVLRPSGFKPINVTLSKTL